MVLAAYDSDGYKIVLVLHILTVVVGLGAVMLNGLYGAQAKARRGPEGLAIAEANFKVTKIAEYFIYAIPVFGIALVAMSDDRFTFEQTWIWLSILLYVVALGISHGVMIPSTKKMLVAMREMAGGPPAGAPSTGGPPPQAAQLEALGKRLGTGGMVLNLITVVIIVLMVWQPGV
ncbi:MAG: DUF2269 family protein [Actinomycetota bacterium]